MSLCLLTAASSEIRLDCSGLYTVTSGKLQGQRLCSIFEQPAPLPVSPCKEEHFFISTLKLSSFKLYLLSRILCPAPLWRAYDIPTGPGGLLSYHLKLCVLQSWSLNLSSQVKSSGPFQPGDPSGPFPQSCSPIRQSPACGIERGSCMPEVGLTICPCWISQCS